MWYMNNPISRPISFLFRCGDRLLAVDGQSLENIPHHLAVTMLKRTSTRVVTEVVSWMGTELWYDMNQLFVYYSVFSWNWFHGKRIKTKFWYKIHICSHVERATCSPAISTTNILFWMRFSDRKNHIPTTTYYYSQFPKRWWYNTINLPMKYILWI